MTKKKYYEDLNQYRLIQYEIDELSNTQKDLVNRRNESYSKEKEVKNIEKSLGGEIFKFCSETDILLLKKKFRKYSELINFCDINKQNFINKLFFNFIKNKRFIDTNKKIKPILDDFNNFLKEKLPTNISDKTLNSFRVSISELEKRIIDIEKINDFIEHTNESFDWEQLSEISGKKSENYTVLNNIGHDVWDNWLKIVPFALDRETRQSLASVSAQISQIKYETEQGLKELQRAIIRNLDKLRSAKILNAWALTSLSVNSKIPMEAAYFDLVIFDEASQCDIASALPLLYRAKRAVIIGDPFQLKHISSATAMQEKASRNKWNIQEASWWYTPNSLYDMAAGKVDKVVSLLNHHRSHADIIEFSNQTFYSNRLRILTSYRSLKSLREGPAVRWLNCSGKTIRPLNKSAQNQAEADSITKELRRLVLEQQYAGSIGVVTPFRGQVDAIMKKINTDNDLKSALIKRNFLCDTVDRFQGDERDLMFFSCVISDGAAKSAIGFLSNDRNRFNVAVTRARGSLIIVGNRSYIENSGVKYLEDLSKYVASKSEKDKVTIEKLPGENYPEVSNPESVSNLEKIFYEALYNNEIHTIPQYPVENYRLDLALITKNNRKLDIEIDGRDHYQGQKWTNELVIRDQLRNQRLYELGWDVIRFTNPQISNNLNKSIEVIKNWQKQDHLMYSHRSFNKMYPYV